MYLSNQSVIFIYGGTGEQNYTAEKLAVYRVNMKILLVLREFNRHRYDALADQAWNTALNMTADGQVQCVIAAGRNPGEMAMEVIGNVQIRRFGSEPEPWWARCWKKHTGEVGTERLPGLEIFLDKNQFDLVHIMCTGRLCVQAAEIARKRNIPYVISCRSEDFRLYDAVSNTLNSSALSPFQTHLRSYGDGLMHAARIFCSDHNLRRHLAERLGDRKLIHWPCGVNVEFYSKPSAVDFRQFYQLPKSRNIILSVGRICCNRNQKMLLDILAVLRNKNYNCHLVVIGPAVDAGYLKGFQAQITALKLDGFVTYIPGLPPGDEFFKAAYQAASLVLLPGRYAVGGSAVLEAWSTGVPVVVSPVGGGGELVIDGENGRVASPGDFQQWINCCCELLDERNRSQLEKMRSAGMNVARNSNWDKRLSELMEIYKNCIKK